MLDAHALLTQAERQCQTRGARFTPIRRRVLEMIATAPGGLKAYDLLDRLAAEHASARPPTVYRALEFLIEQGLVHRIESLNAYVACPCPEHAHGFQLLICRACGRVEELHMDEVGEQLSQGARQQGYRIERQTIELLGLCADCHQAASA
ncbi:MULTISPECIES: transcriptional repressor [Chromohalobacter]|uniref:Ferric uptake regulation protein n=2 Tax=Chromohalobacter israelensis TaxID=141390 RepID=Q1QWC4_CHRI1|nr:MULTISPECIES: transcriptional repressor [Chromohalobacter]ABE59234.1 ferric uptake regulator, Fur family [Chromohalobacter salexigens DSM 3043]MBZ5877623.1 transcriptional repressor [Chromohalobacter salexigens]MDF9434419.1 transcriptional repressor [Chromohalobacter israelensis]MDO0946622.1 transcriptional repressor [Chromohalobacter salexigens]NQY46797.1 transcriptional repressor [Chromohalobacter sp.]